MDFLDAIGNDAQQLALSATKAGSVDIQSDITGLNLTPVIQQSAVTSAANSQLIFLLVIGFVLYKFVG